MSNLYSIFEETVARFPARTAVEVQKRDAIDRYTYDDLHRLTLGRAAWLTRLGIVPGDRVAILAHNDAHWSAAYLGILAAGGIVVPLDTNYSAPQVATILRESGARLLFTSERLRSVAEDALHEIARPANPNPASVNLADREDPANREAALLDLHAAVAEVDAAAAEPGRAREGSAAAVILYTSGTTADPKGVILSHANLIAERDAAFGMVNVSAADSVLGVLPLFHSLAQLANLLLPFAVGARVVYLETLSSQELVRALAERRITVFACVPQFFYLIHERILGEVGKRGPVARWLFRVMLAACLRARRAGLNAGRLLFRRVHAQMGRQLRLFVTGGSRFDPAVGRDLYALGFTILQAYGLTETSGAVTISTADDAHLDTVGRPLPGISLKLLPPEEGGGDGEIAVRGPVVMQGYFNRPEATRAVMRDGWFLTGDLGRVDANGRLTITGRRKDVIILANGKNLYPEEIEAHYRQSPFVKELCVGSIEADGTPGGERLYAVVVPDMDALRERRIVNAGELLRFELEGLGAALPSYKRLLGYEIWFEPLPRTTTGKLKRHEILTRLKGPRRETAQEAGQASAGDEAWQEDPHVAAALAIVRRRAREAAPCTPNANLELDLGLDSMERVELLAELEQELGARVPQDQTHHIFTLGQLVEAVRPIAAAPEPAAPAPAGTGPHLPAPAAPDALLTGLLSPRPFLEPWLFLFSRLAARMMAAVRVTGVEHLPADGAFLICPNHQSYLDPFFVCGVLPYRTLARAFFVGAVEYFDTPFMAWVARKIHCVPVDPDSNLVPAMQAGAFGLAHGKVLILFPEGERSIDGTVKRFKKGALILARQLGVPIVPVAIRGAYQVWPRGGRFNWRGLLPWRRSRVAVRFGEPLRFDAGESDGDGAARLQSVVDAMWQAL